MAHAGRGTRGRRFGPRAADRDDLQLRRAAGDRFEQLFTARLGPSSAAAGAVVVGLFVTESSPNTYPALPVREGEQVAVWLSAFPDRATQERHDAALSRSDPWAELSRLLLEPPRVLRLGPTPRSRLRAG